MTMVRKTVTLDERIVEAADRFADGNLSKYINDALMARIRLDGLRELVAEDVRRRGPIDEESAAATLASIRAVEALPYPGGPPE